jgi:CBS domain-containing protein
MIVQQILKLKADGGAGDGVVTIAPSASVGEAVKLLSEKRIGAVIVSNDGKRPMGILSERDIVRSMGKLGAEALDKKVQDLMTADLVSCTRADGALEVLERMTQGRFRHMPVVEDGEMIGLISIGDTVFARLKELAMEKEALTGMIMGN